MSKWLTIAGIGEDGYAGLGARAREALASARHVVGSDRTLAMLPASSALRHEWPQPFAAVVEQLKSLRGEPTVVLATGDPMNFGVARKILTFVAKDEVDILPGLSAFALAAARVGWSIPDCDCFTIHGRPAASVEGFIQPDARLLILTEDASSVAEVCRRLVARGFGGSGVTVLENMGGEREAITRFAARELPTRQWSPLNTLAVHCVASANARIWSRVAGLPDDAFRHDGKITKREARAATLAALAPAPDQLLWDVGAGSGSVGIEWMRAVRGCEAIAIEPDAERRSMIAHNADQLGTPRLRIIPEAAPRAYDALPAPHAVFIGGGISEPGTFEGAWERLQPGGRMVANVVTLEGEMHLYDLQEKFGGELVRMDISTLTRVGTLRAMRPRMAVTQWR
ncbi:MAG: precorrin-6y C5,15-methyltransferase (decarboxylating) subunit CbiE, partial [Rhizobiales bacterium]|nr:precorrin-6y C5,15-methyltransferase (decarboxylating) subunit CbiE [Hyphomicrobiales bacterium]